MVFVLALVALFSIGRTLRVVALELIRRRPNPERSLAPGVEELEGLRDAIEGAISRLDRLEEERDFYKDLLDSPQTRGKIGSPAAEDAADSGSA